MQAPRQPRETVPCNIGVLRFYVKACDLSTRAGRVTLPTWGPPPLCKQNLLFCFSAIRNFISDLIAYSPKRQTAIWTSSIGRVMIWQIHSRKNSCRTQLPCYCLEKRNSRKLDGKRVWEQLFRKQIPTKCRPVRGLWNEAKELNLGKPRTTHRVAWQRAWPQTLSSLTSSSFSS